MYCSNCGKEINENDNFCRYCGKNLHENVSQKIENKENNIEDEEFVLYDVKKHWMSLFWSVFLTPFFFFYFWNIFLNTHSFFSWVVVVAILILIFYPIARYKSDKIIITNKFAHIKAGVINPEETDIPLNKLGNIEISQSSLGRMFDYGTVLVCNESERIDYGYIKTPEDLQYIIDDPERFIDEVLCT